MTSKMKSNQIKSKHCLLKKLSIRKMTWGGTLGISGWDCAAGILELLAYTRASSAEFCQPTCIYTRVNSSNHSFPRLAVFQKLMFQS